MFLVHAISTGRQCFSRLINIRLWQFLCKEISRIDANFPAGLPQRWHKLWVDECRWRATHQSSPVVSGLARITLLLPTNIAPETMTRSSRHACKSYLRQQESGLSFIIIRKVSECMMLAVKSLAA